MMIQTTQKPDGVDLHVWLTKDELDRRTWVATMMSFFDKVDAKYRPIDRWNRVYIHSPIDTYEHAKTEEEMLVQLENPQ